MEMNIHDGGFKTLNDGEFVPNMVIVNYCIDEDKKNYYRRIEIKYYPQGSEAMISKCAK